MSSLKHLNFKCLDLWGQFLAIHVKQNFLKELKSEFHFLRIAQVEGVDQAKKHGPSESNTLQVAQHWLVHCISTIFANHIKPNGGLCDPPLSFLVTGILMVKNIDHFEIENITS